MMSLAVDGRRRCGVLAWFGMLWLGAASACLAGVSVEGGWIRTPPPEARAAAGYLVLINPGPSTTLVGAVSPAASSVTLHESRVESGMAHMNPVAALALPPGQRVVLSPGGYHLMFMGLTRSWQSGERVPVTLRFGDGQTLEVVLTVADQASGR